MQHSFSIILNVVLLFLTFFPQWSFVKIKKQKNEDGNEYFDKRIVRLFCQRNLKNGKKNRKKGGTTQYLTSKKSIHQHQRMKERKSSERF